MEIVRAFTENNMNIHVNIQGTYKDPLFRASDIGVVLDISTIRSSIRDFDDTEKVVHTVHTPGGLQEVAFLTEKGLYKILFRSRKEIAKIFQDWVCEVIKEIRLNGAYDLEKQLKLKDQEIKEKEQEYENQIQIKEQELKLKDQQREKTILNNFVGKMIFYIGFADALRKILKFGYTYRTNGRLEEHKDTYNKEFTYEYVFESIYAKHIETKFKNHDLIKRKIINEEFNGQNRVELIQLDNDLTLEMVNNIALQIKNEIEAGERNKDKDALIDKLTLENLQLKNDNKVPHITFNKTDKFVYIEEKQDIPDYYRICSSESVQEIKNIKFSHNSEYAPWIMYDANIQLSRYSKDMWTNIKYDKMKLILDFYIMVHERYNIVDSIDNLGFFIARYRSNRLLNSNRAREIFNKKFYEKFIDEALVIDLNEKASCGMILDEFKKWYKGDKDLISSEGNDRTSFREELIKNLKEITKLNYGTINICDKELGLKLSKVSGFTGLGIKNKVYIRCYSEEVYKEYIDEFITVTNNPRHKVARKEILEDFMLWTQRKNIFNKTTFNTTYSSQFMKEIISSIEKITKIKFDNNKTKLSVGGIFEGMTHKNFNCLMNETPAITTDKNAIRRDRRKQEKEQGHNSELKEFMEDPVEDSIEAPEAPVKEIPEETLEKDFQKCTNCHAIKHIDEFGRNPKTKTIIRYYKICIPCRKVRHPHKFH